MATAPERYVVIGASGILAPLGALLTAPGITTTGIARGEQTGVGWDEWQTLDAADPAAVTAWLEHTGSVATTVAYAPAVGDDVWPLLRGGSDRLVVVATTEWAAPEPAVPPWSADLVVQLGWVSERDGTRWHTPEEVSTAVADLLADRDEESGDGQPVVAVVGAIRPWVQQPR